MTRFPGSAYYYSLYRPTIPEEVAGCLIREANRAAVATTLLDLGTGTGQVVEALRDNFLDIIAVDPDPEMLEYAKRKLEALISNQTRVRFIESTAENFTAPTGWSASLVTISRAFHWMNQPVVLKRLSDFVPTTGVVAILGDRSFWTAGNTWNQAIRRTIQEYLGEERRVGEGKFNYQNVSFAETLRHSPFKIVTEYAFPVRRQWNTDQILGYLYSTSFAARANFGSRIEEFESRIRKVLYGYSNDDTFLEENEFTVYIGQKA